MSGYIDDLRQEHGKTPLASIGSVVHNFVDAFSGLGGTFGMLGPFEPSLTGDERRGRRKRIEARFFAKKRAKAARKAQRRAQ